jgi:hypothetical protein
LNTTAEQFKDYQQGVFGMVVKVTDFLVAQGLKP